jgi:GNAT superfamily N-acetyltransferase
LYWLQKTTQYFDNDDEFIMANRVSTNMWNEFLNSMDEEYDTWKPDYQSTPADEFAEMVTHLDEGISPPLFLIDKSTNKIIAHFHVNFCGIDMAFQPDKKYNDKLLYLHSYVVKKEYQRKGLAKKYLKMHIGWIDTVGVGYENGEIYTYDILTDRGNYIHTPLLHKSIYHYARTNLENYGSRNLCKSLGFKELKGTENNDRVEYILETKL